MDVSSHQPEPIKGKAAAIGGWAERAHVTADDMDDTRSRLSFLDDLRGFKSLAIDAIRDSVKEVRSALEDTSDLYRALGRALDRYARVLAEEQPVALRAAEEFYDQRSRYYRAESKFDDFTRAQYAGHDVDLDDGAEYRSTMGNAKVAMEEAWRAYREAVLRVDRAGKESARLIDESADTTNLYDNSSFVRWGPVRGFLNFAAGDFMDDYSKNLELVATLGGVLPKGAAKVMGPLGWISLVTTETNNWAHAARGDITARDAAKTSIKNLTLQQADKYIKKGGEKLGDNVRKYDVPAGKTPPKATNTEQVVVNAGGTAVVQSGGLVWGGVLGDGSSDFDPTLDPAYKEVVAALERGGREFVNHDGVGVDYGRVRTPALTVQGQTVTAGRVREAAAGAR